MPLITSAKPVVAVVGPTGSGKSELAIFLAQRLSGEVVGCDSIQVYSGLNVGSAKPLPEQQGGIPHHLIDILRPNEKLTAGAYSRIARTVLSAIAGRNAVPIVAGGTGLYFRALLDGLSPAPPRDEGFRDRLKRIADRRPDFLHRYLRRFDAASAQRIHSNDRQKMTRAVELCHLSRRRASDFHLAPREALTGVRVLKLGLMPDRILLYQRLDARVNWMFSNGLLEETKQLLTVNANTSCDALQSLGYRQAAKHLKGELTLTEAIAECQTKTRQYAKRQLTWFRAEGDMVWINGFGSDDATKRSALELAAKFLLRSDNS